MGSMFRSDKMSLCDVYLQPEVAFEVLSNLGEMGCVQFIDMQPELQLFQRNFVQEVCRCSEMERKLHYMQSQMKLHDIQIEELKQEPNAVPIHELVQFEALIEKWTLDITEITSNESALMKNYLEFFELLYVLEYIGPLLGEAEISKARTSGTDVDPGKLEKQTAAGDASGRLNVITGVVRRTKAYNFETMLWRMSHGMIHYRQAAEDKTLKDPNSRQEITKVAFLAICQGPKLAARVLKVCSCFKVNTYPCPNTFSKRMTVMAKLDTSIKELEEVLNKTRYLRCKALRTVSKQWYGWMAQVKKSKAIYHQMNMFNLDISSKVLIGQSWVPDSDLETVNTTFSQCCWLTLASLAYSCREYDNTSVDGLRSSPNVSGYAVVLAKRVAVSSTMCNHIAQKKALQTNVSSFISRRQHNLVPPTYNRVNNFTRGFQNLINAYGTCMYREVNPGLYTVITFPFLFGIMFGDVGHGLILLLFGIWMCVNEKKFLEQNSKSEIWNIIFGGRYIILLMGVFSIFTGMCYNDCFGMAFTFGRSYFKNRMSVENLSQQQFIDIDPRDKTGPVYLLGLDPMWLLSKNRIMIENSIKMKLSIIVGIIHMIFGVLLSIVNYRYFKNYYYIILQFIPEVLILCCLFLWLVIMIYMKWLLYGAKANNPEYGSSCAPQILILFIDMALFSVTKPADENCKSAYMFEGQRTIQMVLVITALSMVPILLLGTPLYKLCHYKRKRRKALKALNDLKVTNNFDGKYQKREEELNDEIKKYTVPFGELMVHQAVHTIEYVLSTISHTASYLRLWALSLAHSQLSEMLFNMVLAKLALHDHTIFGSIKVFAIFAVWASFGVCILVIMEGLSAFLHTLRLHWVEFMSHFFIGGGSLFEPFSFKLILKGETDTEIGCKKLQPMKTYQISDICVSNINIGSSAVIILGAVQKL